MFVSQGRSSHISSRSLVVGFLMHADWQGQWVLHQSALVFLQWMASVVTVGCKLQVVISLEYLLLQLQGQLLLGWLLPEQLLQLLGLLALASLDVIQVSALV